MKVLFSWGIAATLFVQAITPVMAAPLETCSKLAGYESAGQGAFLFQAKRSDVVSEDKTSGLYLYSKQYVAFYALPPAPSDDPYGMVEHFELAPPKTGDAAPVFVQVEWKSPWRWTFRSIPRHKAVPDLRVLNPTNANDREFSRTYRRHLRRRLKELGGSSPTEPTQQVAALDACARVGDEHFVGESFRHWIEKRRDSLARKVLRKPAGVRRNR